MRARVVLGCLCVAGFVATFLVALHTAAGLHDDLALYRDVSGTAAPGIKAAGTRALRTIDATSLVVAAVALAAFAGLRRRFAHAAAAVGVIVLSVGSVELLKRGLPHIAGAVPAGRAPTFPSGHTAVAASVGFALVFAVPPVLRPAAALVGASYAAGIGLSLVVVGAHEPSDVVASLFVCAFWACVLALLLHGTSRRLELSPAGVLVAVGGTAVALLAAAELARRHPAAVAAARSSHATVALAALLGVVSLALFASVAPLVGERTNRSGRCRTGCRSDRAPA